MIERSRSRKWHADMAFQEISKAARAARRKSICSRSLEHGPASCPFWWESCPGKVKHCLQRFIRENQQAAGDPDAEAEALARWQLERDKAVEPQGAML